MNALKAFLWIAAAGAWGLFVAELILGLGPRDAGICIAIGSASVLGIFRVRAVQAKRRRDAILMAAYRDREWQRRAYQARRNHYEQEQSA